MIAVVIDTGARIGFGVCAVLVVLAVTAAILGCRSETRHG